MASKKVNRESDEPITKAAKRPTSPKPTQKTASKESKARKSKPRDDARSSESLQAASEKQDSKLTYDDALALAEALVDMVNQGAEHPIAFFISPDDALGRELMQRQASNAESWDGLVPVIVDAPFVHRYAMLTVIDELLWRKSDGS
ncbi:MAG TPA: hypothetical protein PKL73_10235 [Polyangiaceae bacterium]|jgi:hypothetical protein|nr:MAG: hypothetical protein BWY17_00568 [Deltaproteobacteria bacterium ADurb.Bin207]HNS97317.1 hypothetical protein [Polyangiaceae bacterium]HNZ23400.1 hypothetical protein [Polyangiaceae bacterium]HOD22789.1 hypothetical protein [Polyangiaceae bacterium]HOE49840.1 hypothetical protein [Polyangiaceae bacterium]